MEKKRINLGFADAMDDFNPNDFQPKPKPVKPKRDPLHREGVKQAAEALGFKSREVKPSTLNENSSSSDGESKVPPRRRRTGRNVQFNLKARPSTIDAYCAIADANGWGLGETFEKAVVLLEKQFGRAQAKRAK